jgi:hypothetical protein
VTVSAPRVVTAGASQAISAKATIGNGRKPARSRANMASFWKRQPQ